MAGTKPGDVYAAELYQPDAQAADVTLEGPAIPQGRVVKIEAMIIVDVTTGNKTCRLGYDRGGTKYWMKREAAGSSGYGIALLTPMILVGGEKPVGRIESATLNDDIYFIARGIYL